jgi:hypothetical protein
VKRQEFLLNLTLLVIIAALAYLIYDASQKPTGLESIATPVVPKEKTAKDTETKYAAAAERKHPNFGKKDLFAPLLTPTPSPTPSPTPPPPTPDIGKALGTWKLQSVYEGVAVVEDTAKSAKNEEGAVWEMHKGDKKQVDVGNGIMKTVTLEKMDVTDPWNPAVDFSMEDTTTKRTIHLTDEPGGGAPGAATPGGPAVPGVPGAPPQR